MVKAQEDEDLFAAFVYTCCLLLLLLLLVLLLLLLLLVKSHTAVKNVTG
jgi:flagellar biosynthesis protein FliR